MTYPADVAEITETEVERSRSSGYDILELSLEEMTMVRNPHKMTLDERVAFLENASALLRPQSAVSKAERARVRRMRDEVCISLIVDGYKQHETGAWYHP